MATIENECMICLEPCSDTTSCCKAPIHASCLCDILEKGHGNCPNCRKDLYPHSPPPHPPEQTEQTEQTALYIPIPIPPEPQSRPCIRRILEGIGITVVVVWCLDIMSGYNTI